MNYQDEDINALERHCPRLGGTVQFFYCRSCGESAKVCFKILDCWWERFDVTSYLKDRLTQDEYEELESAGPPSKVGSLIDLIQKARCNGSTSE